MYALACFCDLLSIESTLLRENRCWMIADFVFPLKQCEDELFGPDVHEPIDEFDRILPDLIGCAEALIEFGSNWTMRSVIVEIPISTEL